MITVSGLSMTAVKGTRVRPVEEITLGQEGAEGNRRFYVIDKRDRMVNAKQVAELLTVVASFEDGQLLLTLPDGSEVSGAVTLGAPFKARFFSRTEVARLVDGPWSEALSELAGQPLRLVAADGCGAVDRGTSGAVTLISRASLDRLAGEAGAYAVDARRFRMLIEIDGVEAHGEDDWVGRRMRVGGALVSWDGHVGRCLVTSRDPDSGVIDLPTLDVLRGYRAAVDATESLPFGIYGSVLEGGVVRVGDKVRLV